MADQEIICTDCSTAFIFTEGEAAFYASKNLSAPRRCKACRDAKRANGGNGTRPTMHDAVCVTCGETCQVPFMPKEGRPVFCRDCFKAQQQ